MGNHNYFERFLKSWNLEGLKIYIIGKILVDYLVLIAKADYSVFTPNKTLLRY